MVIPPPIDPSTVMSLPMAPSPLGYPQPYPCAYRPSGFWNVWSERYCTIRKLTHNNNKLLDVVNSIVPTVNNMFSVSPPPPPSPSAFLLQLSPSDPNVAIMDSGITCNFIQVRVLVTNIVRVRKGKRLVVAQPDGSLNTSTHTCDIPLLSILLDVCRRGYIFPSFSSRSLLIVSPFCDHGCITFFAYQLSISTTLTL